MRAQTVSVADFGLKPDTRKNAVPYVRKAIEHCKANGVSTLTFPKGRYDFWPHNCVEREYFELATQDVNPKRLAILIEEMERFAIEGDSSDFVFHDRMPYTDLIYGDWFGDHGRIHHTGEVFLNNKSLSKFVWGAFQIVAMMRSGEAAKQRRSGKASLHLYF